jgi:hypothetical protein
MLGPSSHVTTGYIIVIVVVTRTEVFVYIEFALSHMIRIC